MRNGEREKIIQRISTDATKKEDPKCAGGRGGEESLERNGGGVESMAVKKLYTLEGELLSPIITNSPLIKKGKIWIRIVRELETIRKPLKSYVGKLVKGERRAPDQQQAYRGFVRITIVDNNEVRAKKNIEQYLRRDCLGSRINEGFGKVRWLNYREEEYHKIQAKPEKKKFKIRKGLGPNYPKELQKLLIALMLHDFVKTEKHSSKIFAEINIEDEEIKEACKNHHNGAESKNKLLPIVKYYDQLAAYLSRKNVYKINGRYDHENGTIDFGKLAREIEERQHSVFRLYHYIYHSKELNRIVESMTYGKKSLRNHLLLMVNLAINSHYNGWLEVKKGKIILNKEISTSVDEKENLDTTRDAEMHPTYNMSNAKSESYSAQ